MAIMAGAKVKTTDGLTGHVENRYDLGTVVYYIVKMEDGNLYKYFADQLVEIEEEPEKAPEEEPTESDTVTITRDEFRNIVSNEIAEILATAFIKSDYIVHAGLSRIAPVMCANIENTLFGEPRENV